MKTGTYLRNVVITGPPIAAEGMEILARKCNVECTEPYLELAQKLRDEKTHGLLVRMGKITGEVINAAHPGCSRGETPGETMRG